MKSYKFRYNQILMDDVNSASFWEESYRSGRTGWDLGMPTPVFKRLADSRQFSPGKMLVICAGRGYDARMFARQGFQVTAVDFAEDAVKEMQSLLDPDLSMEVIQADLFDLPVFMNEEFDYILEYTCFCAIDPQRRAEYIESVSNLLKPGGYYIALAFPIGQRTGGPPFLVSPDELIDPLGERGFELVTREIPDISVPGREGIEELLVLKKKDSFF
jgi:SAM-dependent methyltransferase